jgi:chorismate synthase
MSSHFGHVFRISTWGESHGGGVGVVIDGCPPLIELAEADIQRDLDRRRPGQSEIVTPRDEADACRILSGVFEGKTLGTPICVVVMNKDARPEAYREMESAFRPSHADFTYQAKFGIRNWQGGGRASARETIGRVAAAAIGKKVLAQLAPAIEIVAYVKTIHELVAEVDPETVKFEEVEANIVRCPDAMMAGRMIEFIKQVEATAIPLAGSSSASCAGCPPDWANRSSTNSKPSSRVR